MARRRVTAGRGVSAAPILALALLAGACALDLSGTGALSFDAGGSGRGDATTDAASADASSDAAGDDGGALADSTAADTATADAPKDTAVDVPTVDACADGGCGPLATCKRILDTSSPPLPSGLYTVDPDGAGPSPPIQVWCDMTTDRGGWTLVGRELSSGKGQFRYLDADTNNPLGIANGTQTGLVGKRFVGTYGEVWIDWGTTYIRFTRPITFDMFANVLGLAVALPAVSTNDARLTGWLDSAGSGKLCVASRDSDVRPGDTSWGIVPADDNNTGCGCNSSGWMGRGAYYGGAPNGMQTACNGSGGGWAGVKDDTEPKGNISQTVDTKLWIR